MFHSNGSIAELQPSASRPHIKVLLATPRGFCAGVRRAIDAVRDALAKHGAPVYVRRAIVHNLAVVHELEAEGAIFVEEVDEVPKGAVLIFSAHGVAPAVKTASSRRGLTTYDAVCPLVSKVHREVERHRRNGRAILLIGHGGHPEIEGTLGHVDGEAHLISSVGDVSDLPLAREQPAAFAVQTTYSVEDAAEIIAALRERFSDLDAPVTSDICYATTNRQAAVRAIAGRADAIIVAGEHFSSNACRLAEVAAALCPSVQLVASADAIEWGRLPRGGSIGITAAASTPERSVQEIIDALAVRYSFAVEEVDGARETTQFKRLPIL